MPSVPTEKPTSSSQHTVDTLQLLTLAPPVICPSHKMYFKSPKFCHCRVLKVVSTTRHIEKMLHQPKPIKQPSIVNPSMHRNKHFSHPILYLYVREMLRKEIRAVKLVLVQRVKEVTTDGADAARQPTDIQY